MGLKQEMEVAMKLLEKDTHEKQDTLAALRLQLDQVKTLNVQMFNKAQVEAPERNLLPRLCTPGLTECVYSTLCDPLGLGTRGGEKTGQGCGAGAEDGGNGEGHDGT